jgi:phosphopantetheine--protein transferase-like protein
MVELESGPGARPPWNTALTACWVSIADLAGLLNGLTERNRTDRLELWLTDGEREHLARLSVPKRRREWLAGRIAAKEVVRRRYKLDGAEAFRAIEIQAITDGPKKGKPRYRVGATCGVFDLSISHSGDCAVAALASRAGELIGIDIEQDTPREAAFEELALSASERDAVSLYSGSARARAVARRWVLKEALSKALGAGLRLPFDRITVVVDQHDRPRPPWFRLEYSPRTFSIDGELNASLARVGGVLAAMISISPSSR